MNPTTDWPAGFEPATAQVYAYNQVHTRLTWSTFGLRGAGTVREFEPCARLGWEGAGRGSTGYHRWDLQRTDNDGTLIVTEEVQGGILARLLGPVVKRSIEKQHQHWLEALLETAAARPGLAGTGS
jgi:hypothetical protein